MLSYVFFIIVCTGITQASERDSAITSTSSLSEIAITPKSSKKNSPSLSPKGSPNKLIRKVSATTLRRLEREKEKILNEHRKSNSDYVIKKVALETIKSNTNFPSDDLEQKIKDELEESEGYSQHSPASITRITQRTKATVEKLKEKDVEEINKIEEDIKQKEKEIDTTLQQKIIPIVREAAKIRAERQTKKQLKKIELQQKEAVKKQKRKERLEKWKMSQKALNKKIKKFFKRSPKKKHTNEE